MEHVEAGRESQGEEKLRYPRGVFFVVYNGFCDRFAYYGIKAVLILYLTKMLLFGDDEATQIYHLFFMFCTFIPLFGASIADSFVGKFKTIAVFTAVYVIGNTILTAAAIPLLQLPRTEFSILGLALIAIGTGCVKPCVVALGGDQFKLPEQEKQLSAYFSMFYFAISAGALIASFLTPVFRKDVSCFDGDCYSLAFATTTLVMVSAFVTFLIGKVFYTTTSTDGSIIVQVGKCISHALVMKYKKGRSSTELHWLDHAVTSGKYERTLIEDIKAILRVLVLYLTFPMFWALMEQQGSRWTLQASRMNGGLFGITIKPDHIQVVNPLLVLALIPAFDKFVYPAFGKMNFLKKPLQRLAVGGLLASLAFFMSGMVELKLESIKPHMLEVNNGSILSEPLKHEIVLLNALPCTVNATLQVDKVFSSENILKNATSKFSIPEGSDLNNSSLTFAMFLSGEEHLCNTSEVTYVTLQPGISKEMSTSLYHINYDASRSLVKIFDNTVGKDVNMLWLLPQFFIITIAEVMFAVTGMEFSYSQAPASMKSVMQSAWLVAIASGNLIVTIIAKAKFFSSQSSEFFLFAVLMFLDMLIFMWLASNFKTKSGFRNCSVKPYREIVSMSLRDRENSQKVIVNRAIRRVQTVPPA